MKHTFSQVQTILEKAKDYEAFLKQAMKKFKITDIGSLDDKETTKFFDWIDKNWDAKNESVHEARLKPSELKKYPALVAIKKEIDDLLDKNKKHRYLPRKVSDELDKLMDKEKQIMRDLGLDSADYMRMMTDSVEVVDEVLSIQGRRKLGQAMKKNAKKNARKREISMSKKASPEKIKQRATKAAINKVKATLTKGKDPSSPAAKEALEKKMKKKAGLVKKLAKKLIPAMKKAEKERLASKDEEK
jgi:DNA-directed RNA polymerase subunit N (RpoN/RPB10)